MADHAECDYSDSGCPACRINGERRAWQKAAKILADAIADAPTGTDLHNLIHHVIVEFARLETECTTVPTKER